MGVAFKLEEVEDENTGVKALSIVQYKEKDGKIEKDVWCSIQDIDKLFAACVDRWNHNWNLEKVVMAIRESEID